MFEKATELVITRRAQQRRSESYYWDPVLWAKERAGIFLWSGQRNVAASVVENHDVAVKAGHSVGKSLLAAVLICWWMDTRWPDGRVASTAPSAHQIGAIVWYEVRNIVRLVNNRYEAGLTYARMPGYITSDNVWKTEDGDKAGFGRKPPDHKTDDAFQGVHARKGGVLAIGDEACHDEETEVLTDAGWLPWPQVREHHRLLTWNTEQDTTEYLLPQRLVNYHYSGEMVHYKNQTTDFMVTPNHELVYEPAPQRGTWKRGQAGDIVYSNKFMRRSLGNWEGEDPETFTIPAYESERKKFPELTVNAEDFARLLGWFGSEGSLQIGSYSTRIWQNKTEYRDEIRALLSRLPFDWSERKDHFNISGGQLHQFLLQYGRTTKDKRVPDFVRGWSPRLIGAYLDAYGKGDGYRHSEDRIVIYTSGKDMASDLHECAMKAGYSATVMERPPTTSVPLSEGRTITSSRTGYVIYMSHRHGQIRLRKENVTRVAYDGQVYCATMPRNNTLFTRRHGKTLWSGNCGLSEEMIDALGNITSNEESRRFLILNPTNPSSHVGKLFKNAPENWTFHTISVFDNPNFTGEEVPDEVRKALSDQSYVDGKRKEYGEGTPRYISRVLGEFAFDNDQSLIREEDMAVAHDLEILPLGRPVLGVDVARYGNDMSVVYTNFNGRIRLYDSWGQMDGVVTAEKIHNAAKRSGAREVRIDATGIGGPIADFVIRLRDEEKCDYRVIEMVGGGMSEDRSEHANARAQWYDRFRYDLKAGRIDLDFEDTRLTDELMSIQYKFRANNNALLIESKDEMRKRGMKSPDYADAVIYAAADMSYLDRLQAGDRVEYDPEDFEDVGYGSPELDALSW